MGPPQLSAPLGSTSLYITPCCTPAYGAVDGLPGGPPLPLPLLPDVAARLSAAEILPGDGSSVVTPGPMMRRAPPPPAVAAVLSGCRHTPPVRSDRLYCRSTMEGQSYKCVAVCVLHAK